MENSIITFMVSKGKNKKTNRKMPNMYWCITCIRSLVFTASLSNASPWPNHNMLSKQKHRKNVKQINYKKMKVQYIT